MWIRSTSEWLPTSWLLVGQYYAWRGPAGGLEVVGLATPSPRPPRPNSRPLILRRHPSMFSPRRCTSIRHQATAITTLGLTTRVIPRCRSVSHSAVGTTKRPVGRLDGRLWSLDVLSRPGERNAEGVFHTSPGQRPGKRARTSSAGQRPVSYLHLNSHRIGRAIQMEGWSRISRNQRGRGNLPDCCCRYEAGRWPAMASWRAFPRASPLGWYERRLWRQHHEPQEMSNLQGPPDGRLPRQQRLAHG